MPPETYKICTDFKKIYIFFCTFFVQTEPLGAAIKTTTHKFYFNYYTPLAWIKMMLLLFFNYLYLINTISLYRNNRFMLDEMANQNIVSGLS